MKEDKSKLMNKLASNKDSQMSKMPSDRLKSKMKDDRESLRICKLRWKCRWKSRRKKLGLLKKSNNVRLPRKLKQKLNERLSKQDSTRRPELQLSRPKLQNRQGLKRKPESLNKLESQNKRDLPKLPDRKNLQDKSKLDWKRLRRKKQLDLPLRKKRDFSLNS